MDRNVDTLAKMKTVAAELAKQIKPGDVVYLIGDLGAGKTTFVQFLLQSCGVKEHVKSPTYTLYETYQVGQQKYIHMDLYRLSDPEELYFLGIEDFINDQDIVMVEWPDKGYGVMPKANWILEIQMNQLNRTLTITSD